MSNASNRLRLRLKLLVSALVVCLIGSACAISHTRPPTRGFSTSDLLISSLPDWELLDGPTIQRSNFFNLPNSVGGSTIRFVRWFTSARQLPQEADANQWVVQFPYIENAAQAFRSHQFSTGTGGTLPRDFERLPGFNYTSAIANQFRVVCDLGPQSSKVETCFVEGQYDEFYTLVNYQTFNRDDVVSDLEIISRAIDSKMSNYLGSERQSSP